MKGIPTLRRKGMLVMKEDGSPFSLMIESHPDPRGDRFPDCVKVEMPGVAPFFIEDQQIENLIGLVRAYREENPSEVRTGA